MVLGVALLIYVFYSFWNTEHPEHNEGGEKEVLTLAPQSGYQSVAPTQQHGTGLQNCAESSTTAVDLRAERAQYNTTISDKARTASN